MRGERRAAGRARTGAKLRGSGAKKVHYPLFTTEDSKVLPPFRGLPLPSRATTTTTVWRRLYFLFCLYLEGFGAHVKIFPSTPRQGLG